jgi:YfiH family protein
MTAILRVDGMGAGCAAYFTGRDDGVSTGAYASRNLGLHVGDAAGDVVDNRRRTAREVGVALRHMTFAEQVHGSRVALVRRRDRGRGALAHDDALPDVDGLVTSQHGTALCVLAADCVPLLFADVDAGVVAAAHAGWRGATAGIVTETAVAMMKVGARAASLHVAIGPSIRGCCYEVDDPVVAAVTAAYRRLGQQPAGLTPGARAGHTLLDLVALCRAQLQAVGVAPAHIVDVACCTHCMDGFFSYRRAGGPTGRHAGIIVRD